MKYLSVCSGVEAATVAWHELGWTPVAFSEIDKFPNAVLAHHYPDVPNWGDATKFKEWPDADIDLLVAGTPCQAFSIAGLRKGLEDPRGNLTLTFLAIADRYRPEWVVWENVPGVLSEKTGALQSLLDGLEEIGYIVDIDILDAQFFGVPQRRRRVFVCGQRVETLTREKTDSSAAIIGACLLEILHGILIDQCLESVNGLQFSASPSLSRDGAQRRMRLFGLHGAKNNNSRLLQNNLVAALERSRLEQKNLDALHGEKDAACIPAGQSTDLETDGQYSLTEQSLSSSLEGSFEVMKSFITSTSTNSITPSEIYSCSKAVLLIAKLMLRLNPSCPPWWSGVSSSLIALQEFTNYARSSSSDLFGDIDRIQEWTDFIREAELTLNTLRNAGTENFGKLQLISESLSGNPAPSKEAGEAVAGPIAGCSNGGGPNGPGRTADDADSLIPISFNWQNGGGYGEANDGLGITEDGTGPLSRSQVTAVAYGGNRTSGPTDVATACNGHSGPHGRLDFETETFLVFDETQVTNEDNRSNPQPGDPSHPLVSDGRPPSLASHALVRRLTPKECGRLQGFPDGYLDITYRGKPAANGPKYKALGNSFAVPVVRWIGQRIQLVVDMTKEIEDGRGRKA